MTSFNFQFLLFLMISTVVNAVPTEAPVFEKAKYIVGGKSVTLEIADSPDRRGYGLMNRKKISDSEGMLFVFDEPEIAAFWMKDTLIPLSIGFFDSNNVLFEIRDMEPASLMDQSPTVYKSKKEAKFALEVAKGWFLKFKIKIGAKLKKV